MENSAGMKGLKTARDQDDRNNASRKNITYGCFVRRAHWFGEDATGWSKPVRRKAVPVHPPAAVRLTSAGDHPTIVVEPALGNRTCWRRVAGKAEIQLRDFSRCHPGFRHWISAGAVRCTG